MEQGNVNESSPGKDHLNMDLKTIIEQDKETKRHKVNEKFE